MIERYKKLFIYLFGFIALVLTAFFIYSELHKPGTLQRWATLRNQFKTGHAWDILILIFILMLANWAVETIKWRFLLLRIEKLSIAKLISSLLAGLSLALFTPARLGEYGGRVIYLQPQNRVKGTLAMLVGGISQMLATVLVSLAGLSWFIPNYFERFLLSPWLLSVSALFIALILLLGYFKVGVLENLVAYLPFFKKFSHHFSITASYTSSELFQILIMSLIRYSLFTSQYYFLLSSFLGKMPLDGFIAAMSIVFVIQSLIPAFALADLGIKGASATYLLGLVLGPGAVPAILAATFGIWLINIILPALCGLFFIVKIPTSFD